MKRAGSACPNHLGQGQDTHPAQVGHHRLIPKGGGDYCGIGLLEPIWKVVKRVMDQWLEVIAVHDSLHGCCNWQGTGTAAIKAKLAQPLDT
jgi:hypothetical protein